MNESLNFVEDAQLTGVKITDEGYLTGYVNCARTGIQIYSGDEVGRPEMDVVRVYRPEEEVFSTDSLRTIAYKPLTNDHPPESVNAKNWRDFAVGSVAGEVLRDGDKMRIPITLMDFKAIEDVQNGKRELSNGYRMKLVFEAGETKDGQAYDAIQTEIKMNHVAIVDRGRAGSECRIGDSAENKPWGASPILTNDHEETKVTDKNRTVIVDGLPVVTTDAGAAAIDKLQKDNAAIQAKLDLTTTDHDKAMAAKDAELAGKDEEIKKLTDSQLSTEALDAKVVARTALLEDAKLLAKDADFTGMDDNKVRATAIIAARGEDAMKDKSVDYINAAFDHAVDSAKAKKPTHPVTDAVKGIHDGQQQSQNQNDDDNGQAAYEQSLRDGYKGEG